MRASPSPPIRKVFQKKHPLREKKAKDLAEDPVPGAALYLKRTATGRMIKILHSITKVSREVLTINSPIRKVFQKKHPLSTKKQASPPPQIRLRMMIKVK
jgi:hypothetical protein